VNEETGETSWDPDGGWQVYEDDHGEAYYYKEEADVRALMRKK
jgi:hypothetical protein